VEVDARSAAPTAARAAMRWVAVASGDRASYASRSAMAVAPDEEEEDEEEKRGREAGATVVIWIRRFFEGG